MLPEALLHGLELLHAVDALRLRFREDEARKCFTELHPARAMCHTTKARAVPVDLASLRVKRAATPTRALPCLSLLECDLGFIGRCFRRYGRVF